MARSAVPSPPVDLEALEAFLMSPDSPPNSMGLSDLDGFLTGLVVGPEGIRPAEWMPLVWGGEEPEFDNPAEADAILGTIMARYNEILDCLETDPETFDPVFLEGPEGQVLVTDWAAGFMDAVILRPKRWAPILEDQAGREMIMPLLVLGSDDDRPLFDAPPMPADEIEKLVADGADVVVEAVIAIYEFWDERRVQ